MYIRTLFVLLLVTAASAQKTILALKPTVNASAAIMLDYVREGGRKGVRDALRQLSCIECAAR